MQQVQKVDDHCTRREIVPRAAGEWDNTSSATIIHPLHVLHTYNIFFTIEQKNDKQQFSPVRRV
jgi:hypothetical protein